MDNDSQYSESLRNSFVPSSFVSTGTSVFDQDFDTTFKESTLNDQSFIDPSQKLLADDNMFPEVFEEKKLPEDQKEEEVPTAESIIQKMKNDEAIAAERDKVHNRESSPFIKTVMAERTIVESEYFNMHAWAEFQEILRSNFFVIKNEYQSKENINIELSKLVQEYNEVHLQIRQNNDTIKKKLDKEEFQEQDLSRVILDDKDSGLGDIWIFMKKLLYHMHEKPKILATIVKNHQNHSSLKVLEETLCSTYYEDIIADEVYDDDLLRLLSELLETEFEKVSRIKDLVNSDKFTNRMIVSYLKRPECKRYIKFILKNPLLASIKETSKIRLNPEDVQKYIERKQKSQKSTVSSSSAKEADAKMKAKMEASTIFSSTSSSLLKPEEMEKERRISVPIFKRKKPKTEEAKEHKEKTPETAKEEDKSTQGPMNGIRSPPPKGNWSKEVLYILDRNFKNLKRHLTILIQSIFDNLYSMPIGLRILCKIIHLLAQKKAPNSENKAYNEVVGIFLFWKWIIPNFTNPIPNGIVDDWHTTDETGNNLLEIGKVLQYIFSQTYYPADDVRSALNEYIRELQPSVEAYYKELMSVNDELVEQIRSPSKMSPDKIKSRSVCISLHEIRLICDAISKQKEDMMPICPEVYTLTERILFYVNQDNLFTEKIDPYTKNRLTLSQSYVLFYELITPPNIIENYLEEFNKIQGFSKLLSEDQKFLCRAKHLLKQFLIGIEDIKSIMKISTNGTITLDELLEKYQDKLYSHDSKHSSKEKTPVHISARFLISTLKQLDKSYTENNYYKLYKEMFEDFKQLAIQLDFSISTTKLQLLKALDNLKRSCKNLNEVNEKKLKVLKKTSVRDFIKTMRIPLCITSPSTMKNLENNAKKTMKKKTSLTTTIPDKIEITLRDEKGCIHERFAIIRELAANHGVLGGMPPKTSGGSKLSISSNSSKGSFSMGEDIFNINNYHCDSIDDFIQIFASLQEVKDTMQMGEDKYGVNKAIIFYYNKINLALKNASAFRNNSDEEFSLIMDEIENYICKRLYNRIFPSVETEKDRFFYKRCKLLEWTNFEHLEVIPRNRCEDMWDYAAKVLNQMDYQLTPLEKLDYMVECFKTITQVLELASAKEGGGGADETLPIMLYVLLRASPKRIHSNINFITLLRDSEKMQAREGYCFTQVESAVLTIESLDHRFFKMEKELFEKMIAEKEEKYFTHKSKPEGGR